MSANDFYNSKAKVFLISCLVFISGLALASFLPVKFLRFEIWWFVAAIFFLLLILLPSATSITSQYGGQAKAGQANNGFWRNGGAVRLGFLLAAVFLFAIWRYAIAWPVSAPDKIWYYHGQTVAARGIIANEPDIRETSQKLEIAVRAIRPLESPPGKSNGSAELFWLKVNGKLLVTAPLYPEYKYGDELAFVCELKPPAEFNGFAYDRYLARSDIYSVCYYPKILSWLNFSPVFTPAVAPGQAGVGVGPGGGNWLYAKIFAFKKIMSVLIDAGMSEPESSLARSIVFGGQRGLEQSVRDNFQKVGLTHIMAVSGFNVSILAAIIMAALLALGLSRRQAFYLASIFLAGYIILVGLPASAMRAGLMGFLVLWALKLGRLNKMTNSLILAATVLLLLKPKLLRDDVGFQLSFLAMAGLVYVYPIFDAWREKMKLPKLKGVSDAFLITLAAQVFTWPALAYNFSRISLIAPLANLAVLWVLPLLTILILIALPLSFILPGWSFIFFSPSLVLTKYILAAVKFFAGWPYGYLVIDYFSLGWVVLYYFFVIFLIIKLRRSKLLKDEINGKI